MDERTKHDPWEAAVGTQMPASFVAYGITLGLWHLELFVSAAGRGTHVHNLEVPQVLLVSAQPMLTVALSQEMASSLHTDIRVRVTTNTIDVTVRNATGSQ